MEVRREVFQNMGHCVISHAAITFTSQCVTPPALQPYHSGICVSADRGSNHNHHHHHHHHVTATLLTCGNDLSTIKLAANIYPGAAARHREGERIFDLRAPVCSRMCACVSAASTKQILQSVSFFLRRMGVKIHLKPSEIDVVVKLLLLTIIIIT